MIVKTFLLFLCIQYVFATTCDTTDGCKCRVQGSTSTFINWDAEDCNQCLLLGIENACADEENMDMNTFQIGFWAPGVAGISQDSMAVVKLKATGDDITNQNLLIRGFNRPEYQGCKTDNAGFAAMSGNDYVWSPGQTEDAQTHQDQCAAANQMWFFNVHVHASIQEVAAKVDINLELDVGGTIYVTKDVQTLEEETVGTGSNQFQSRGLHQIHTLATRPKDVVFHAKKFDIDCDGSVKCPYEGEYGEYEIETGKNYAITAMGQKLRIEAVGACDGIPLSFDFDVDDTHTFTTTSTSCTLKIDVPAADCNAGFGGADCVACANGFFSNGQHKAACTACADFSTTPGTGRTISDCQCKAGYSGNAGIAAGTCTLCSTGTFKTSPENVACSPCAMDSFNGGTGNTACTACADFSTTPGTGRTMSNCQCKAGYSGNAGIAAGTCTLCSAGTYKTSPGNVACSPCAMDSTTNLAGSTSVGACACKDSYVGSGGNCLCPSNKYRDTAKTPNCQNCPANSERTTTGATQKDECLCSTGYAKNTNYDENIANSVFCTDTSTGTGSTVTQTITLYNGINYFSFYVSSPNMNIVQVLNTITGITFGTVIGYNTIDQTTFSTSTKVINSVLQFPPNTLEHKDQNVYILTIATTSVLSLQVTGTRVSTIENLRLKIGENWLPVVFDTTSDTKNAAPIQVACTASDSTACQKLQYVQYDQITRLFTTSSGVFLNGVIQMGENNWDTQQSFLEGQTFVLQMVSTSKRNSFTNGYVRARISDLTVDQNSRVGSYSSTGTRRLLSAPEDATFRHLLTSDTVQAAPYCATTEGAVRFDVNDCRCTLEDTTLLSWPIDDCNKCVFSSTDVCEQMGAEMVGTMTFNVHVLPPNGISVSETSSAVAKLKRSFALPDGVKYEHLSIRGFGNARASGCATTQNAFDWSSGALDSCVNKLYTFPLSMKVKLQEMLKEDIANALEVNFEFFIEGQTYVTERTERLNTVMISRDGQSDIESKYFDIYKLDNPYNLVIKQTQIICPLDRSLLLLFESECPFEGVTETHIEFDIQNGGAAKNIIEDLIQPHTDNGILLRKSDANGRDDYPTVYPTKHLSYIIAPMPGETLYVTIEEAVFDTCSYAGMYYDDGTYGCDPALIASGDRIADGCDATPWEYNHEPVIPEDKLTISRVSAGVIKATAQYDGTNTVDAPSANTQYVLSDMDESLEIVISLDGYECLTSPTKIRISISTTQTSTPTTSTPAAVDRLQALSGDVCHTAENCVCVSGDPVIPIAWPVDECNKCVLDRSQHCNSMGTHFLATPITYFLFIDDGTIVVTKDSVAVGKLKNSNVYDPQVNPLSNTGAEFQHLSIRGLNNAKCEGCYTNTWGGDATWGPSACASCSDELSIFFFQISMKANDIGEIAVNGADDANILPVNFEFYIGGVLYVTDTVKGLARVQVGNEWDPNIDLPVISPPSTIIFPQRVHINAKQFEIICPLNSIYTCPYEGDVDTQLRANVVTQKFTTSKFSFRTVADADLHISLDSFVMGKCDSVPRYGRGCDPNKTPYYGDDCWKTEPLPVPEQMDKLHIVHYTVESDVRTSYIWIPGSTINGATSENGGVSGTTSWILENADDLLEITIINDGINLPDESTRKMKTGNTCDSNDFDMLFKIQSTPSSGTPPPPPPPPPSEPTECDPGKHSESGSSCAPCAAKYYKEGTSTTGCTQCSGNRESNDERTQCKCGDGKHIDAQECVECSQGTFKLGMNVDNQCAVCDGNKIVSSGSTTCDACGNNAIANTDKTDCDCPHNTFTATGSGTGLDCTCPAGKYMTGNGDNAKCEHCASTYFKNSQGIDPCTSRCQEPAQSNSLFTGCECPADHTGNGASGTALVCIPTECSTGASTYDNECQCNPGYSGAPSSCSQCDAGEYKEGYGNTLCQTCPADTPLSAIATVSQSSCFACTPGSNTVASDTPDSCVCQPGHEKKPESSECTACTIGFYKQSKGDNTCSPCINNAVTNSIGSMDVNDCKCDAEQGWKLVGTSTACTQPEIFITKFFTLNTEFTDFDNDVDNIRTKFKTALMQAYDVVDAKITLTYHDTNTPNLAESGRRRRLLQTSDTTTITAKITVFDTKSNDVSDGDIQTALDAENIFADSITILHDATVIEENGSSPDTMLITVIVVVSCVFVCAVGCVAYQLHKTPQSTSDDLLSHEAQIANSTSQTVFISDSRYNAENYFDVYYGPQSL